MKVQSRQVVSLVNFKKKKGTPSEKEGQKSHFFARFYQRVGYNLSESSYRLLQDTITKEGLFLHPGEKGGVYLINFQGIKLKVVYNFFTQSLITVLP